MKVDGFSLIELTISMSILALMASLGFYAVNYYDRLFVHLELNRLYALLRSCSTKALLLQAPLQITFSPQQASYACNGTTYQLTNGTIFGTVPNIQGPPANPEHPITKPITFVGNKITINAKGKIQPGTIYLTDTHQRWLYALTCPVGQISYLRRYRYFDHVWVLLS